MSGSEALDATIPLGSLDFEPEDFGIDEQDLIAAATVIQKAQRSKLASQEVTKMRAERSRLDRMKDVARAEHAAATMIQRNHRAKSATMQVKALRREMHATVLVSAFQLFEMYDLNGDGSIDRDEYWKVSAKLQPAGTVTWTREMSDAELDSIDSDHNGRVNPEEFYTHCRRKLAREQATFDAAVRQHQDVTMPPGDVIHPIPAAAFWIHEQAPDPEVMAAAAVVIQSRQRARVANKQVDQLKAKLETELTSGYNQQELASAATLIQSRQRARVAAREVEALRLSKGDDLEEDSEALSAAAATLRARQQADEALELAAELKVQGKPDGAGWSEEDLDKAATVIQNRQRARKASALVAQMSEERERNNRSTDEPYSQEEMEQASRVVQKRELNIAADEISAQTHHGEAPVAPTAESVEAATALVAVAQQELTEGMDEAAMTAAAITIQSRQRARAAAELVAQMKEERERSCQDEDGPYSSAEMDAAAIVIQKRQRAKAALRLAEQIKLDRERAQITTQEPWTEEEMKAAADRVQAEERAKVARDMMTQMKEDEEEAIMEGEMQDDPAEDDVLDEMRLHIMNRVEARAADGKAADGKDDMLDMVKEIERNVQARASSMQPRADEDSMEDQIRKKVEDRAFGRETIANMRGVILDNVSGRADGGITQQSAFNELHANAVDDLRGKIFANVSHRAHNPDPTMEDQIRLRVQERAERKLAEVELELEFNEEAMASAAIAIQSRQRAKAAREMVAEMKAQREREQKPVDNEWSEDEMTTAATAIQARQRAKAANLLVAQMKEERARLNNRSEAPWADDELVAAATTIQARQRAKAANLLVLQMKEDAERQASQGTQEETDAATKIQSRQRARVASKEVKQLREQHEMTDEEAMVAAAAMSKSRQKEKAAGMLVAEMREGRHRAGREVDGVWTEEEVAMAASVIQNRQCQKASGQLISEMTAERARSGNNVVGDWSDEEMSAAAEAIKARKQAKAAGELTAQMKETRDPDSLQEQIKRNVEARALLQDMNNGGGVSMTEQIQKNVLSRSQDLEAMRGGVSTGVSMEEQIRLNIEARAERLSEETQTHEHDAQADPQEVSMEEQIRRNIEARAQSLLQDIPEANVSGLSQEAQKQNVAERAHGLLNSSGVLSTEVSMEDQIRARVEDRAMSFSGKPLTTGALLGAYQTMLVSEGSKLSDLLRKEGYVDFESDVLLEAKASSMHSEIVVQGKSTYRGVASEVYLNRLLESSGDPVQSVLAGDEVASEMVNAATMIQKQQRAKAAKKRVKHMRDEQVRERREGAILGGSRSTPASAVSTKELLAENHLLRQEILSLQRSDRDTQDISDAPSSWPEDAVIAFQEVQKELGATRNQKLQLISSLSATQDRLEQVEHELNRSNKKVVRLQNELEMETRRATLTRRVSSSSADSHPDRASPPPARQKTPLTTHPLAWKQKSAHRAVKHHERLANGHGLAPVATREHEPVPLAQGSPSTLATLNSIKELRRQSFPDAEKPVAKELEPFMPSHRRNSAPSRNSEAPSVTPEPPSRQSLPTLPGPRRGNSKSPTQKSLNRQTSIHGGPRYAISTSALSDALVACSLTAEDPLLRAQPHPASRDSDRPTFHQHESGVVAPPIAVKTVGRSSFSGAHLSVSDMSESAGLPSQVNFQPPTKKERPSSTLSPSQGDTELNRRIFRKRPSTHGRLKAAPTHMEPVDMEVTQQALNARNSLPQN